MNFEPDYSSPHWLYEKHDYTNACSRLQQQEITGQSIAQQIMYEQSDLEYRQQKLRQLKRIYGDDFYIDLA